jgi:hypothetical protein
MYNFSIGAGVPVEYVSRYSSLVTSAAIQAEYCILRKLDLTASINYYDFIAKGGGKGLGRSLPFINTMVGLRYYFFPKVFLSAQAGMGFYGGRDKGDSIGGSGEKYFAYAAPAIGFVTSKHIEVLLVSETVYVASAKRYYSSAGIRIGYNFHVR